MRRRIVSGLLALLSCTALASSARAQSGASQSRWTAQIAQADAAAKRGDRRAATQLASTIIGEYTRGGSFNSAEHVLAGRAYVLLSSGDASAARAALAAFDAGARDATNLEATRRTGQLFLSLIHI